jgi:hypothetical protein
VDSINWMKDILVKSRASEQTARRTDYLEAKYDSITGELQRMETKFVEEEEIQEMKTINTGEEKSVDSSMGRTDRKESKTKSNSSSSSSDFHYFPFRIERMDDERKISSSTISSFSSVPKVKILFDVPSD